MYIINRYTSLVAFAAIGFITPSQAQKQITHQGQYWLRYYGKYKLSTNSEINLEIDDRRFFKNNRQANWVLPRITFIQKLGAGWSIGAGFTFYTSTNPADPSALSTIAVPEFRPHLELDYKQAVADLSISHRFKLEERWTRNSISNKLTDGYNFKSRFRYQLQLQYPLVKKASAAGALNAKVSDEIMLNIGHSVVNNTFDQNRLYVALNYGISNHFQVELGYMNYFQERSSGTQYYERDIARLTIYHSINFYKKH